MAIKVQKVNNTNGQVAASKSRSVRGIDGEKHVAFHRTLTDATGRAREEKLTAMIGDIEQQGKKLSKRVDISELERYRELVRGFLDDVVSNGYEFSRDSAFGGRGRARFFATVNTVNEKLTELAQSVINSQAEELDILAQVGEIQGLLVDLMV
ncbi:MAG: YaaR family protein [Oscillospiraceae bacterium]|jgi:uncharacterized protein YaaR (DUF327 family)|nr:YaaR family protein [Oscillospiraceae bacterium]